MKHPRVYALADMFLMEDLKSLAVHRFRLISEENWTSEAFAGCIEEIYARTNQNGKIMRDAVVDMAQEYGQKLWEKDCSKDIIRNNGDFAVDFVERYLSGVWSSLRVKRESKSPEETKSPEKAS